MVQETFLKEADKVTIAEIKGYGWKILSDPRKYRSGGGIAILHKPHIILKGNEKVVKYKTFQVMEAILTDCSEEVRFINVYRPPYTKKARFTEAQFLDEFDDYLDQALSKHGLPLITGDFNIHVERPKDHYPSRFLNLLSTHDLVQCVPCVPTHQDGGTLDLVITRERSASSITDIKILPHGTSSDHYLVHFDLDVSLNPYDTQPKILEYRNFSMLDKESFKADLMNSPICSQSFDCSLDEAVSLYNKTLRSLMDKYCPVIKKKIKTRYAPWIDDELRTLRMQRRRAERAWRKNKCPQTKAPYNHLKHKFDALEFIKRCQ